MFSIFATLALSDSPYVVHMNSPMFRDLVINRKDTEVWHVLFVGVHPKENQKEVEEQCAAAIAAQEKAANMTHRFCKFAIINITTEPFLAARSQIQYIPYISIYHPSGVEEYRGNHKADSYVDAITNRMPNLVRPFDRKSLDESIPSIVLFTDQIKSPTLWASLSLEYKDAFARFSMCSDFYMHKQFSIARLPTVMFFNSTTQYRYRGELTEEELKIAIEQFLNGTLQIDDEFDDEGFYRLSEFKQQCFGRDYCVLSTWSNISDTLREVRSNFRRHPMKFFYGNESFPFESIEPEKFYIWKPRGHGIITVDKIEDLGSTIDRVLDGGARFQKIADEELAEL
jgi:hypothetical protein